MKTHHIKNNPAIEERVVRNPFASQLAGNGSQTVITDNGVNIALPSFTPQQLRTVRQRLGLTQRQFGLALGFATGANARISEYESGKQPIPAQVSLLAWYMEQFGLYSATHGAQAAHPKASVVLDVLEHLTIAVDTLKNNRDYTE